MPILPMFPLGTALLPGAGLPLHVFEPRYQQLVRDCSTAPDGPRFGVVLIARGHEVGGGDQRNHVGTVARILLDTEIGGGRHVLECVAEERIRIDHWLPDDPYPRAEVEPWPDTDSGPVDMAPLMEALERLHDLLDRLTDGNAPPLPSPTELPDDPGARLFAIARHIPMGEADRYAVLATPGPAERVEVLTESVATAIDLASWKLQN